MNLEMTDEQYKQCTIKIKAMADVRPLAIDDTDSIISAFHRGLKLGTDVPLLPDLTEEEKKLLAEKVEADGAAAILA